MSGSYDPINEQSKSKRLFNLFHFKFLLLLLMWGTLICTLGLLVWLKALQKDRLPEILWALERKWLPQLIFW